jgi:hypothetical protein
MSDIKNVSSSGLNNINEQLNEDKLKTARNGNFQGANVNSVAPPQESPLSASGQEANQKQFSAARIAPPSESPLSAGSNGYRIANQQAQSNQSNAARQPSNDQLFDHATGASNDRATRAYLEQDPAASKAVAAIQRGHQEIGSPDNEPQLDGAASARLDALAKSIFRR